MPKVARAASELADRIEHDRYLSGKARVHQREFGNAIEQHAMAVPKATR